MSDRVPRRALPSHRLEQGFLSRSEQGQRNPREAKQGRVSLLQF